MIVPRPQVETYENGKVTLPNTVTVSAPQRISKKL